MARQSDRDDGSDAGSDRRSNGASYSERKTSKRRHQSSDDSCHRPPLSRHIGRRSERARRTASSSTSGAKARRSCGEFLARRQRLRCLTLSTSFPCLSRPNARMSCGRRWTAQRVEERQHDDAYCGVQLRWSPMSPSCSSDPRFGGLTSVVIDTEALSDSPSRESIRCRPRPPTSPHTPSN